MFDLTLNYERARPTPLTESVINGDSASSGLERAIAAIGANRLPTLEGKKKEEKMKRNLVKKKENNNLNNELILLYHTICTCTSRTYTYRGGSCSSDRKRYFE